MNHNEPTAEQVRALKEQFPDRTLYLVETVDQVEGADVYFFVMTAPLEVEYKKFTDEMVACDARKGTSERIDAVRAAIRNAALAQIRYPDREEAKRVLAAKPHMLEKFAAELQKHAGAEVELRSKKL